MLWNRSLSYRVSEVKMLLTSFKTLQLMVHQSPPLLFAGLRRHPWMGEGGVSAQQTAEEEYMQSQQEFTFAFERLDVYQLARQLTCICAEVANTIPRGYGNIKDQLLRSGSAPARLIAEGALRKSKGSKRQRFEEALGECGEAVATAQQCLDLGVISQSHYSRLRKIAERVAAMTSRLVTKFS
jgi:four helix bundle protein